MVVASSLSEREASLACYYDRLTRWAALARLAGHGHGVATLTTHRALFDATSGRTSVEHLHGRIAGALRPPPQPRGLDAGCGLGGTMLDLHRRFGGDWLGITLSPAQARRGEAAARRRGVAASCRFALASYDAPPAGPFDVVVAVESLAHSDTPAASVAALARRLAPGGTLLVVDDMPEPGARHDADFHAFAAGWQTPRPLERLGYAAVFAATGLVVEHESDLTALLRPRREAAIARLERLAGMTAALPLPALRAVLDSHRGGLALERLYRRGLMRYVLLAARREGYAKLA